MGSMNVSWPEALRAYVEQRVREGGDASGSEYVREPARRAGGRERLRTWILRGVESARSGPFGHDEFGDLVVALDVPD